MNIIIRRVYEHRQKLVDEFTKKSNINKPVYLTLDSKCCSYYLSDGHENSRNKQIQPALPFKEGCWNLF